MLIKEVELLLQAGVLQTPVIKPAESNTGWIVVLQGTHQLEPVLQVARGGARVFKRLDAAVGLLFDMGIVEVKVVR